MIWLLGALTALGSLSMDVYLPGLPGATQALHASASAGQLTLTSCMLGIAFGQLIGGPISDARGRRRPILAGMVFYTLTSAACGLTASVSVLVLLRLVEGVSAGVAIVVARTVIRDIYEGHAAARKFATLMTINGITPVLAPLIGGQLLRFTDWRGIFIALAIAGAVFVLIIAVLLHETLPAQRRQSGGLRESLRTFGRLLGDRRFAPYAFAFSISFGSMFAYIAGSSFVLENVFHTSPQVFSVVFAVNSVGLVVVTQVGARLLHRYTPAQLFRAGVAGVAVASAATFIVTITHASLALLLITLFVQLCFQGLVLTNGVAAAMADHPSALGSASALLGLGQYGVGSAVAPLVGIGGVADAVPMGIVMVVCGAGSLAVSRGGRTDAAAGSRTGSGR